MVNNRNGRIWRRLMTMSNGMQGKCVTAGPLHLCYFSTATLTVRVWMEVQLRNIDMSQSIGPISVLTYTLLLFGTVASKSSVELLVMGTSPHKRYQTCFDSLNRTGDGPLAS